MVQQQESICVFFEPRRHTRSVGEHRRLTQCRYGRGGQDRINMSLHQHGLVFFFGVKRRGGQCRRTYCYTDGRGGGTYDPISYEIALCTSVPTPLESAVTAIERVLYMGGGACMATSGLTSSLPSYSGGLQTTRSGTTPHTYNWVLHRLD